ncbi:MAG: M3 family oligoendopeptidase [candidate division Zixibacteria bacterium]|nr:M3 family oligoendopeptidase [candidate division Zixibacteria bacterium]
MTTTTTTDVAPRWELDSLFRGGSTSSDYAQFVDQLVADIDAADQQSKTLPQDLTTDNADEWAQWILSVQDAAERLDLAYLYALSLISQDVADVKATSHTQRASEIHSRYKALESSLESFAMRQSDEAWETLMAIDGITNIRFYLDELRRNARLKMDEPREKLALELSVNGYHAWHLLYEKLAGDLRVSVEEDGETKEISLGQNSARLSSSDRNVRRDAFEKMEGAWETVADLAAMTLNSQGGFRLSLYKNRGWDSALQEPLMRSRMTQATLDAMWNAISKSGPELKRYVRAKCDRLGIDKFCWYDQEAPIGATERKYPFEEAGDFIAEHLGSFSPEMGEFTRTAIEGKWIEAEDRPGKRAGGWCSWVPIRKQARIFMTYSNTYDALSTLAHELGHAYHGFVLKDEPAFNSAYPMTLAETASIFNEMRVNDAALRAAEGEEKLALLDLKLQATLTFFCNIRARFLFDSSFYAERKTGNIERAQLSELMKQAQQQAFFGMLDDDQGLHPLFWASKLHFFITEVPFYNYPYTFGYLFAKGVYARAMEEGPSFASNYRNLLADTGKMTTEEVAQRHLGVDLTKPDFWETAVKACLSDVDEFVALVK